jgi:hypothetical protein
VANVNAPFGLRPLRHRSGAPYNGAARLYFNPSGNATALYIGDPVIVISAGANSAAYYWGSAGAVTPAVIGSLPQINRATAGNGNAWTGAIVGFYPEQATSPVYGLASTARGVWVCDDPDIIYEIMDDGVAASTASWPGQTGNFNTSTFSGSTATARSGVTLNSTLTNSTPGAVSTSNDQLRIIALGERANNAIGAFAVWEVVNNNHTMFPSFTGV